MAAEKILFRNEDASRECEWSLPKGFLFGGMVGDGSLADYADEFYEAANILIETIYKNNIEDFKIGNPVLFLYRHAAELSLKALVLHQKGSQKESYIHSLRTLLTKVDGISEYYRKMIEGLDDIDPKSTSFRYSGTKPDGLQNEDFCDAGRLRDAMNDWRIYVQKELKKPSIAHRAINADES